MRGVDHGYTVHRLHNLDIEGQITFADNTHVSTLFCEVGAVDVGMTDLSARADSFLVIKLSLGAESISADICSPRWLMSTAAMRSPWLRKWLPSLPLCAHVLAILL